MYDYETLEDIRDLETFLGFEPQCNTSCCSKTPIKVSNYRQKDFNEEKILKENLITKVRDYFTGNSNIWYTYEFNEKTNDIKYVYPRTFSKDMNNLKNYFTNLFDKNK
jgi:hypothetical protein